MEKQISVADVVNSNVTVRLLSNRDLAFIIDPACPIGKSNKVVFNPSDLDDYAVAAEYDCGYVVTFTFNEIDKTYEISANSNKLLAAGYSISKLNISEETLTIVYTKNNPEVDDVNPDVIMSEDEDVDKSSEDLDDDQIDEEKTIELKSPDSHFEFYRMFILFLFFGVLSAVVLYNDIFLTAAKPYIRYFIKKYS